MNTQVLPVNEESIVLAAKLLQQGELVALPTETVYGIAADARNGEAVKKIFEAKGRPQDNPLIVHSCTALCLKCRNAPKNWPPHSGPARSPWSCPADRKCPK